MTLKTLRWGIVSALSLCLLAIVGAVPMMRNQLRSYGELRREWKTLSDQWTAEAVISEDGQTLVSIPSESDPVNVRLNEAWDGLVVFRNHVRMLRVIRHHATTAAEVLFAVLLMAIGYQLRRALPHAWIMDTWRDMLADLQEELVSEKTAHLGEIEARRWYRRQLVHSLHLLVTSAVLRGLRSDNDI